MRRCKYTERNTHSKNISEFPRHFSSRSHHKLFFGPPSIFSQKHCGVFMFFNLKMCSENYISLKKSYFNPLQGKLQNIVNNFDIFQNSTNYIHKVYQIIFDSQIESYIKGKYFRNSRCWIVLLQSEIG